MRREKNILSRLSAFQVRLGIGDVAGTIDKMMAHYRDLPTSNIPHQYGLVGLMIHMP